MWLENMDVFISISAFKNYHKLSGLKQSFIISQLLWGQKSGLSLAGFPI